MTDWNPTLYARFEDERTRPARDLLARVPLERAARIVDLGCGPGNSTQLLAARFPQAAIVGVDSSPTMIAAARQRLPALRFEEHDIAAWTPAEAPDLIFANAVLQWLPHHAQLLPRLFDALATGGVLAVQMPDNLDEPSHRAMRTVAAQEPWAASLRPVVAQRDRLPAPAAYYDMLAARGATVDVWRTAYQHPLASPGAIVEWVSATGLRPFLDALRADERDAFVQRYEALIDEAYPARADGRRLLAFPRLFIVAVRPA